MKFLSDFFTGSLSSLGIVISIDTSGWLSDNFFNSCVEGLTAIVGGVLSAIILKFLRNKFPAIFNKRRRNQRLRKF